VTHTHARTHTHIHTHITVLTHRAQEVVRQREAQVHKLQLLMAHEAEEMAQLQAFESQVRPRILCECVSLAH